MLQLIVYSLLLFLTLLAICDLIVACVRNSKEGSKKRSVIWTAPCSMIKNRLQGLKTLKEEAESPESKPSPPTVSETV